VTKNKNIFTKRYAGMRDNKLDEWTLTIQKVEMKRKKLKKKE
jgi:hypothetical protein